jgi:cytochrome c oxidase cbb3-type subunit 3
MNRCRTMQPRAVLLGMLCVTIVVAACETKGSQLAAAGAQPSSTFFIGPQPGPDRPVPVVTNPYANDANARVEGRRLFGWYNCAGCHGDHAGGGMGPSLRDTTWRYGNTDQNIFASITEGRAQGMPAWGSKLPQDQIWKLVAYIKSLRTPNEPSPPR